MEPIVISVIYKMLIVDIIKIVKIMMTMGCYYLNSILFYVHKEMRYSLDIKAKLTVSDITGVIYY